MSKISNLIQKLKSTKNIQLYFALVLLAVIFAFVLVGNDNNAENSQNICTSQSYIAQLENKLVTVLDNIDGVDNVQVAIACVTEGEKVYAYNTITDSNGKKIEEVVFVKGEPLVVKTLTPQISGVVVVANGIIGVEQKYKVIQTVVTLLDIDSSCVQVFS